MEGQSDPSRSIKFQLAQDFWFRQGSRNSCLVSFIRYSSDKLKRKKCKRFSCPRTYRLHRRMIILFILVVKPHRKYEHGDNITIDLIDQSVFMVYPSGPRS